MATREMDPLEAMFTERGDQLDELERLRAVNAALRAACQATVEEIDRNGRLSRAGLARLRGVLALGAGGGA
jgi:hypothetical protein